MFLTPQKIGCRLQFLTAEILIVNAQGFKLKKNRIEDYWLKGSSYHNREVSDITNANELIKIFRMIPFTHEKPF